jgi:hypothetical protein
MQKQPHAVDVRIGIQVIDARSIERARSPNDAVDFVAFLKQKIGEITSILARDAGDERLFHERRFALKQALQVSK